MTPDLHLELSALKADELRHAADHQRLVRAAASRSPARSPRERLGRRLISLGVRVAGDASLEERFPLAS